MALFKNIPILIKELQVVSIATFSIVKFISGIGIGLEIGLYNTIDVEYRVFKVLAFLIEILVIDIFDIKTKQIEFNVGVITGPGIIKADC